MSTARFRPASRLTRPATTLLAGAICAGLALPLAAGTGPSLFDADHRVRPLTAPRAADPLTIASDYLDANLDALGLEAADRATLALAHRYRTT
jgi:hypothetical protein